jgi:hypothetical protein
MSSNHAISLVMSLNAMQKSWTHGSSSSTSKSRFRRRYFQMLIIHRHTRAGCLKVAKYHGHERVHEYSELTSHDIIITTYGTIATEHRKTQRRVLYHMRFFRIVLDEGSL